MGGDFNFQVGADCIDLGVKAFDQQDQAKVSVLQAVLIPRIPANPSRRPPFPGKAHHAWFIKQGHDFRLQLAFVQLADGIRAEVDHFHVIQVEGFARSRVNEELSPWGFIQFVIQCDAVFWSACHNEYLMWFIVGPKGHL
ncbi:MAG: hypothetical protein ACJAS0_002918 [Alcanivorax borkumensis]|jgi:hypothetical protein